MGIIVANAVYRFGVAPVIAGVFTVWYVGTYCLSRLSVGTQQLDELSNEEIRRAFSEGAVYEVTVVTVFGYFPFSFTIRYGYIITMIIVWVLTWATLYTLFRFGPAWLVSARMVLWGGRDNFGRGVVYFTVLWGAAWSAVFYVFEPLGNPRYNIPEFWTVLIIVPALCVSVGYGLKRFVLDRRRHDTADAGMGGGRDQKR